MQQDELCAEMGDDEYFELLDTRRNEREWMDR
jgi:hypothetical protein